MIPFLERTPKTIGTTENWQVFQEMTWKCPASDPLQIITKNTSIQTFLFVLHFFYCSGFCHTMKWNSHGFTCVPHPDPPSHLPLPPSLWVFTVHQVGALVSCIQPGLVICFTIDNIHVSMLFSWNIPPLPSPTESKRLFYTSVSLFLFCIYGYHYHLSKFHIYVLVYCNGLYLSGLLHSV